MSLNDDVTSGMFTVAEVARKLKISSRLVYKLVEKEALPCYRIASTIRISSEQIDMYLASCTKSSCKTAEQSLTKLKRLTI